MGTILKELQIIGTTIQGKLNTILEVIFGQVDVIGQIGKANFRFNHPELGQVPSGVTILGTKGGAKCVHIRERTRMSFHI